MARTYLFFHPARLPLEADDLDESTVIPLTDSPALRAALEGVFANVRWQGDSVGRTRFEDQDYEIWLPGGSGAEARTLSLRASLRADHSALVQRLCDRCGWIAFDEEPLCFQPNREPMPA